MRISAMTAIALGLTACTPSEDDETSDRLVTDAGLYELFVELEPDPPVAGEVELTVMIHDASGGELLVGSGLEVTPWMPQHNHGVAEPPVVVEDAGTYTVTFAFSMPGDWELTFDVDGALGVDSLVLPVEVQ